MIRRTFEDGAWRPLTPDDIQHTLDTLLVVLGRFMHQSVELLERRPLEELHRWYAIVAEINKAQNAHPDPEE